MRRGIKVLTGAIGAAAGGYAGYVAMTYSRYGQLPPRTKGTPFLDSLMPEYEVSEVHRVMVQAPANVTLAVARKISFADSPLVRLIFALRAMPSRLTGTPAAPLQRRPILEETRSLGWRQIGENPGRQIIMGAVTQPWKQNVEFRGLSPDEFISFHEPGYAKIAWTFEVDPIGSASSVFRTETRVVTTDTGSRERFRRYWSFLSPGIIIIRYESLRLVKSEAEQEARRLHIRS